MNAMASGDNKASKSIAGSEQPTVFVIDDHIDVQKGLMQLVETVGLRCEIFGSAKEFLERSPMNGPSCIVLDVRLPGMSGLDLQAELTRRSRNIPIIMITGHGDIPMSVRAMKAGAIGFFIKPVPEQELLDAVHDAIEKDRVRLDAELSLRELRERYDSLTDRERQILPFITAGLLNKQTAAEVGLSEITVKVHRAKLFAKLNAKSLPDLVRMAKELNIPANDSGRTVLDRSTSRGGKQVVRKRASIGGALASRPDPTSETGTSRTSRNT